MKSATGFKRDTGFVHIGTAQSARQSGIFLPLGGAGQGGEYGELITDEARSFAMTREPIAHRVTFTVAHDIFDNWFNLKLKKAKEEENAAFDQEIQSALSALHAKRELTRMSVFERGFGWAIIALGYVDDAEVDEPLSERPDDLVQLKAYAPTQISSVELDKETELEDGQPNPHYGYPEFFFVKQKGLVGRLKIHFTRTILWATRFTGQETDEWKGTSTLDPVWDDLVTLRNMRWAMGQTMYRTGAGFFDVELTGPDPLSPLEDDRVQAFVDSGYFDDLNERTYFAHTNFEKLDIKGFQGKALNPEQYYLPVMENISCGTKIPLAILRGAQAGALTGSETNLKEYFKIVSNEQTAYEDGIRELITRMALAKSLKLQDYVLDWRAPFVLTEVEKMDLEVKRMQVITAKSAFMLRNEVRKLIDPNLKDLSAAEGGLEIQGKSVIPTGSAAYTVFEHAKEDKRA
jgi:hypothetical protein